MGRLPRIHFNGAIYHAMDHGVNDQDIFLDTRDREIFLELLHGILADASASLLAYCLMGNHFHLAVKVSAVSLSEIMRRLLTSYALIFNRRHERMGHLFQARYEAKLCTSERYLRVLIPYIIMNPVRAGLVAKPEDWPWSSLLGEPLTPSILAALETFDPWEDDEDSTIDLHRREAKPNRTLEELGASAARREEVDLAALRSDDRRRSVIRAKRMFTQTALEEAHTPMEIARWLNAAPSSVSRYARANTANWKA